MSADALRARLAASPRTGRSVLCQMAMLQVALDGAIDVQPLLEAIEALTDPGAHEGQLLNEFRGADGRV